MGRMVAGRFTLWDEIHDNSTHFTIQILPTWTNDNQETKDSSFLKVIYDNERKSYFYRE